MTRKHVTTAVLIAASLPATATEPAAPISEAALPAIECEGVLSVEAESFYKQTLATERAWHIKSQRPSGTQSTSQNPPKLTGASGGSYVEILPDTRVTHSDELLDGVNFSSTPGRMAVLHYKVRFSTPGRYYVWVRVFSSGTEDNGVHVGLNGEWPESGQRWQTVQKHAWVWDCRQRTDDVHEGVPLQLYLDVKESGDNEVMFSMREDGFAMDNFILTRNRDFIPDGTGPAAKTAPTDAP